MASSIFTYPPESSWICLSKSRCQMYRLATNRHPENRVALALVKALFKKVRPDDPLLLMT